MPGTQAFRSLSRRSTGRPLREKPSDLSRLLLIVGWRWWWWWLFLLQVFLLLCVLRLQLLGLLLVLLLCLLLADFVRVLLR